VKAISSQPVLTIDEHERALPGAMLGVRGPVFPPRPGLCAITSVSRAERLGTICERCEAQCAQTGMHSREHVTHPETLGSGGASV
jgi:hypothetical protein